jgi:hypothetical protein
MNAYVYVRNNPFKFIDPMGLRISCGRMLPMVYFACWHLSDSGLGKIIGDKYLGIFDMPCLDRFYLWVGFEDEEWAPCGGGGCQQPL